MIYSANPTTMYLVCQNMVRYFGHSWRIRRVTVDFGPLKAVGGESKNETVFTYSMSVSANRVL